MTDAEAEAMREQLAKHYGEPVMPVSRYCRALETWAARIEELNRPGYTDRQGSAYWRHLGHILRDIRKSNLLARMIYGGEPLRTRECPVHKGRWTGITENTVVPAPESPIGFKSIDAKCGCGGTGWLPEPTVMP